MKRSVAAALLVLLAAAPLVAQAPKGWMVRADRSTNATDPDAAVAIKIATMGSGLHFTIKGSFTLVKPSGHTNYYGLVFGGSGLDGASQSYIYFMVAQDGSWLVKHRDGAATHDVARALNAAVKQPDSTGKSTNALEVRVRADKIDYVVNGTVVHSTPKTGMTAKTDGIYGIRINHLLEVHVDGFGKS